MNSNAFDVVDYVVMVGFLSVSLGIGVYYGVCQKQTTTEEYLLGSRRLGWFPVAVSLMVSFQSAVSLMGTPAEIYTYDTMIVYTWLSVIVCCLFQAFLLVPLLYPLKLVSTYEFLYMRFQSRAVQLLGAVIGMVQTLLYMAIVLFAPALALESVAGFPFWMSVLLMGLIGTIYTSLGGMRSVIWTDVFQCIVLYGGLIVILVLGSANIGGFTEMFTLADEGKRINFSSINFDPRVRHTVWSCFIGGIFIWLPLTTSQASIQRIASMRNEVQAKQCMLVNIPLVSVYLTLITLTGLMAYAYFQVQMCDPLKASYISTPNQVMPYFVIHVLKHARGLAGLYIAALFSGSLRFNALFRSSGINKPFGIPRMARYSECTFSSGINGMAANTLHDFLVDYYKDKKQMQLTVFAKLIVIVYGVFAVALAFVIKELPGPVTQISYTASGGTGGPLVGMILLGAFFPQANWKGAICGGIIGIAINVWIGVGSVVYGRTSTSGAVPIPTSGCSDMHISNGSDAYFGNSSTVPSNTYTQTGTTSTVANLSVSGSDGHLPLYDLSYAWLGMIGFFVSMLSGLAVSYCTGRNKKSGTDPLTVFPFVRRLCSMHSSLDYEKDRDVHVGEADLPLREESDLYCLQPNTK